MQTLSPASGAMIRSLSSSPTLSAACLDRPVERGWLLRGLGGQSFGSGQPSGQPSSVDRVHGERVQEHPMRQGRDLSDRASSKRIPGNWIRNCRISVCPSVYPLGTSRIQLDRSNNHNWFIDLPSLGQFLSIQDRWQQSGRYGMTVLQED